MQDQHPSFETMVDLVTGQIPQNAALLAHLHDCDHCQQEVRALRRLIGALHGEAMVEVPRPLIDQTIGLLRQRPKPQAPWRQQFHVELLYDSLRAPLVAGVRSTGGATRQVVFGFGAYKLDLRIRSQGDLKRITGQLLGHEGSVPLVVLRTAAGVINGAINELMEFAFPPVPTEPYDLVVSLIDVGEAVITIDV